MKNKYKVVFMGTPLIASYCLDAILQLDFIEVVGVVCQTDKPVGRKHLIEFCPVKKMAIDKKIKILQNVKISNLYDEIKQLKPDLIMTCAFGQFVPNNILVLPKYKCVNLHASLLPKLRGGAPIHHAILNNEKTTGWSLMYMTNKLDAGNVIAQQDVEILPNETYQSLYKKLCLSIKPIIDKYFKSLFNENVSSKPQNEQDVTYAPNITRDDEKIDWNNPSMKIDAKIRAFYDKPIAYTLYNNQPIKIYCSTINDVMSTKQPGTIEDITNDAILVATKDKCIGLKRIQIPGKKPLDVKQIINGKHPFAKGKIFS